MSEVRHGRGAARSGLRPKLTATLFSLLLLLTVIVSPLRSTALAYGAGPLEAARIMLVNLLKGPVRVGIQVGHLQAADHPEEHRDLRWNFGGHYAGVNEVDINLAVALELQELLEARGVTVDLLPASVPVSYSADAFISVHADSVDDPARNGYKSAHFEPERNQLDAVLKRYIDAAYLAGSPLADDALNVSSSMIRYYAFNPVYRHRINTRTPALLVELGYISNPADRAFLQEAAQPASLIAHGLIAFLQEIGRLAPADGDTADSAARW